MSRSDEETPLLPHVRRYRDDVSDRTQKQSCLQETDVLYWCYLLLGFGLLTPWASFMAAVDYIESVYPDRDALRWLTVLFYPPMLLSLILNSSVPFKVQGHNRIACGFLGFSLFLSSIPAMDFFVISDEGGSNSTFALLLTAGACTGCSNGLVEGSVLGLTLFLPSQYYQAYTSGGGAAAIFVTLLRMFCKAALTNSPDGLRISASVFFLTSAFICFTCFLVQRCVIMPHPIFQDFALLASSSESDRTDSTSIDDDASLPFSFLHFDVLRKLRLSLLSLIFLYITTTIMFPGVPADAENATLGDWYKILLVLIYSIGDFVSRLVPRNAICTAELPIAIAVVLRGLLIPIVFFVVRYLSHPFTLSSLMLFLGLTNGYGTLCAFALGQKRMSNVEESFIGGNLLIIALILGINIGSFGSLGWARLV